MEVPPKPDLLYGPRALSLDAFIGSLEAWGKQGRDRAEELETELAFMQKVMDESRHKLTTEVYRERDRYREALEKIAAHSREKEPWGSIYYHIANDTLNPK